MKKLASLLVSSSRVLLAGALIAGCATSAPSIKPGDPVPLAGAQYKLVSGGSGLDGRVVEFVERGNMMRGCLISLGKKLRNFPEDNLGMWVFSLTQKAPNEYEGVYKAIQTNGSIQDKEVAVSFSGDSMTWNQESATWERQAESKQLTPEQVSRCKAK